MIHKLLGEFEQELNIIYLTFALSKKSMLAVIS